MHRALSKIRTKFTIKLKSLGIFQGFGRDKTPLILAEKLHSKKLVKLKENPKYSLISLHFLNLAVKLAKIDGPLNSKEYKAIFKKFQINAIFEANFNQLLKQAQTDKLSPKEAASSLNSLILEENIPIYENIVAELLHISLVDGPLNKAEIGVIYEIASALGASEEIVSQLLAKQVLKAYISPYELLEVNEIANNNEITAAYHKMAKELHPDHLQQVDAAQIYIEICSHKFNLATIAYHEIRKLRGF